MDLQQIVSQSEGERQQDIEDQLNNDILNNTQLSEERTEELKQRVRNLLEPIGQEVFRISGERLLQKYGIKKYYDALKKGDTSALVDAATNDLKKRGQQFIEGKADDLMKRNGFSDEDISNVKNAFKTGDFSNVSTNKLKGLFDNAESLQQNVDVRKALKNQGLNDEDVDDLTSTNFFSSLKRIPDILNQGLASASEKFQNLTDTAKSAFQKRIQDKVLPEDIDPENMSDTLLQLGANRAGSIKFLSSSFTKKKPQEVEDPSTIQMGELPEFTPSTGLKALTTVPDEEWEAYLQREAAAGRPTIPETDPESIARLDRLELESRQLPLTAGQRELVERVGLTEEQARAVPQATDEPSLKGGLGGEEGIPFDPDIEDARLASFRPTISEEPQEGLVSRLVNFFRGSPQEEPQIGPSRDVLFARAPERGVFDTSKIPDFRSAREFEQQFNDAFRDVKSNPTYANILRDEEYPQFRVSRVGGFDIAKERGQPVSNSIFETPPQTRQQVIQQQISSGERQPPRNPFKPSEDEVRGGSYSRGGFKVPAPVRSTTQQEDRDRADLEKAFGKESGTTETTLPPPPPAPSGISGSSPEVYSGPTIQPYAPPPITPQIEQPRQIAPTDTTQAIDSIQETGGITAGTGATLAGGNKMRQYFKNTKNRGNKQRRLKENKEEDADNSKQDAPTEEQPQASENIDDYAPLTDVEDEPEQVEPQEPQPQEPTEAPEEPRPSEPDTPEEPPAAEPEAEDAPEISEGVEGAEATTEAATTATEAATTAATTATEATTATTLTTLGAGEAASNGFLNPLLDGVGLITGIAGILMGSGIFSKKPPTPPSASEVSANPEKYGLPTAPITSTVSESFGGGQL